MPVTRANDVDIYYEWGNSAGQDRHENPPLLFISGSGGDLRNKPNQFDSPLASAFDLLSYDQRGLGQSSKPDGDYTMVDYADDAARLLDALEVDRVPVIGVSFGGMVAQEFALRHPDRIAALVLACTSSGGTGGASYPLHELQDLAPELRAAAHLKVADIRHNDEWIEANPKAWQKRLQMSMHAQRADRDATGARQQLEARRGHDTYDRLNTLEMPVLLVGGEYDGIAPPQNMQAIHAQIGGSELHFYNGGHMFLIQDKSAYPYIIQWLSAVG
jgi:3-oxoadipate enol-lactonase